MTSNIAINTVFDSTDQRTRVVFVELLRTAERYAKLRPDRDVLDLIARAKSIAAGFDGIKR